MTHAEVSGLDLGAMSKTQLKLYAKKAREVWGEWIDLRKADIIALQQYLQDYQAWAARIASIAEKMVEEETTATPEATATDIETATEAYRGCGIYISSTEDGYTARVRDLDSEIDITVEAPTKEEVREQAIAAIDSTFTKMIEAETNLQDLPDFENGEPHVTTLSDFEGIDAPLGDWWMTCALSCDPCNYRLCDLPQTDLIESLEKLFLAPEPDDEAQVRSSMADSTVILQSQSSTITTYYQYRGIDIRVCEESGESYYQVRCWVDMFGADCDSGDVKESLSMAQALIDRRILFDSEGVTAMLVREIRYIRDLENQDIPF